MRFGYFTFRTPLGGVFDLLRGFLTFLQRYSNYYFHNLQQVIPIFRDFVFVFDRYDLFPNPSFQINRLF